MTQDQTRETMAEDDRQAVFTRVFTALLHRRPRPREIAHFTAMLAGENGFETVITRLLDSQEYRRIARNTAYPPGHFYSALVDVAEVDGHLEKLSWDPDEVMRGIAFSPEDHLALWREMEPLFGSIDWPVARGEALRYYYDNKSYPFGDAQVLSALLRLWKPRRIIEDGSGFTSAVMLDTIDATEGLEAEITFVQPFPHTINKILWEKDWERFTLVEKMVQDVDLALYDQLEAGDILFIDSTHVVKTGSDVVHEVINILPRLARGVRVHFHDIFYPFEYPEGWIKDHSRSWNEIYLLRAFLMDNPNWRVVCFNNYFGKHQMPEDFSHHSRFRQGAGGAFWLERVG